ncbi:hypothetical protein Theos_0859 [Thermus oshimai JL-2]|uniref:Telomeric repeat-binding factor 2 n=1 Tax=Thermus oshimai JL-2 TaxID=751945 RepID=K7QYW0_THEOS|nr:hypothetical protein [Thermus oshimai]AFV75915.1 hypothetical protein Theos_0859 [Thermus oshimai JL-2]
MRKGLALLAFLAGALAQQVNLPKPQGPVVEVVSSTTNATYRIQGCARDQEGKVVCAVQIQSNARTNQQITVPHQGVRAVSARGFSYPGYLSVEGGRVEPNQSVFALPAGARVAGKMVFPEVPGEETFFAVVYLGGIEFRGIPIGQAPAPQAPQVQTPTPVPPAPAEEPWKRFVVGPFTFELVEGPRPGRPFWYYVFIYKVTASQDARLQIRFNSTRTIVEGGLQNTGGDWSVSGGRSDFIAGIPLLVDLVFFGPSENPKQILYTEFEVFDGTNWQKIVWRNIPFSQR